MAKSVYIIGGGAAGFFTAINLAEKNPNYEITILEKTSKYLSKVRISGGGRCNLTNTPAESYKFSSNYPRGQKALKSIFTHFSAQNCMDWFSCRGVKLKIEPDGRVFPVSNSSETIINCFLSEIEKYKIKLISSTQLLNVNHLPNKKFQLICLSNGRENIYECDSLVIATGGSPSAESYRFLKELGHHILSPLPSLFTFNNSNKDFTELMGLSVPMAEVKISGTKFSQTGALLITHWGLSGPAVIKLSAWAAEYLASEKYTFSALVSWIGIAKEEEVRTKLKSFQQSIPKQNVIKNAQFDLPKRLWEKLCYLSDIQEDKIYSELSLKQINKLLEHLIRCPFNIKGKTTFKEEFVTCGGVDLNEVNTETMESKLIPNLFFAGEVLNIDGVTGGYNFQSAWSTAWLVSEM